MDQPRPTASTAVSHRFSISLESWIFASICFADMISTIYLVRTHQAIEGNPVLAGYMARGVLWFFVAKSIMYICPLYVIERARQVSPRFVTKMLRLGIALYLLTYGIGVSHINSADGQQKLAQLENLQRTP